MTKVRLLFSTFLLLAISFSTLAFTTNVTADANVNGKWNIDANTDGQQVAFTLDLTQKEKLFGGTVSTPFGDGTLTKGEINGNDIVAKIDIEIQGQPLELTMKAVVNKDSMTGTITGDGISDVTFVGTRNKD